MDARTTTSINTAFCEDVRRGLSATHKFLYSKYFYDHEGDRLFSEIMKLEEYYLTNCEFEILTRYKQELLSRFDGVCEKFHLIEFGAGDALKTKVLLRYFLEQQAGFEYNPIDISENVISLLISELGLEFPGLDVVPLNMDYFKAVEEISGKDTCKKVVLFLGSNIGNFTMEEAHRFFGSLGEKLHTGDQVLVGFDLKKDPRVVLAAYNDSSGVTSNFNLNLLRRINKELDADFDLAAFYHYPVYDPVLGEARSYLVSKKHQHVNIRAIPMEVEFTEAELIFTEISRKYSTDDIRDLSNGAGFRILENYFDGKKYFTNSLWEKV